MTKSKPITQTDVDLERKKIADAKAKLEEFRDKIAKANPAKLKVVSITRELYPQGILQGEQAVVVVFGDSGRLMKCDEINDLVRDKSGNGCRMLFLRGDLLHQDKREAMMLMDYFPEYYVTVECDGTTLINEFRPNYGHMVVSYANTTIMKTVIKSLSRPDELKFVIKTEEDYSAFMKFYAKHGIALSKNTVKVVLEPDLEGDMAAKLQKYIVKDDLRVRYSFPISKLFTTT
jgi:hypothetical protein